jgi:hypothetical protein
MERDAQRVATLLTLLILGAAAFALVVAAEAEPDIWGRIAYARDAAARGEWVWHADVYSYLVPGGRWVDHEWGFSWIAYAVYRLGGWAAIRLLRVVLLGSAGLLCLQQVRGTTAGYRVQPALAFVLALPLALGFIGPRPQALSFLFFAWMCWCFARSWTRPAWIIYGVLPLPLWINIHGGFAAGMAVAGLWCACRLPGAWARRSKGELGALATCAAWSGVSAFVSPWGASYLAFIVRTGTMARPFVEEWNPPRLLGLHSAFIVLFAVLGAGAAVLKSKRWPDLAVLAALVVQSALHRRHLTFLAIATAVFAFPAIAVLWQRWRPLEPGSSTSGRLLLRVLSVALGMTALTLGAFTVKGLWAPAGREPDFPAAALDYLQTQGQGGVLVDFNWAQYVIFRAWPRFQVAVDGRYEEVYPEEVLARYFAWHFGAPGWQALPDDPRTRFALVDTRSGRADRLSQLGPAWKRIYQDPTATVFAKVDLPP